VIVCLTGTAIGTWLDSSTMIVCRGSLPTSAQLVYQLDSRKQEHL
jgi:hypothetical protein